MKIAKPSTVGSITCLPAIALCALFLTAAPSARAEGDDARKIDLADTPAAVRETVVRVIGKGELDDLKKKFHLGKFVYEAEYLLEGVEHSLVVDEGGHVLQEAVEIKIDAAPAPVLAAARQKYPNGKITEVDRVTADGKTFYEVSVDLSDDEERELLIDPDGKVLDDREDD